MSDTKKGDIVTPNSADQIGAILFACNINAVRSAMAETMVKNAFPGKIFVDSCGVTPGIQDGFATAVMQEIGLDLSAHRPQSVFTRSPCRCRSADAEQGLCHILLAGG